VIADIPESILKGINQEFSQHLAYLGANGKEIYMKYTSLHCDDCFRKLSRPFVMEMYHSDGSVSQESNKIAVKEVGVQLYFHEECYEPVAVEPVVRNQ